MKRLSANAAVKLLPWFFHSAGAQSLSILIYHRVLQRRDPMRPDEPTIDEFDGQMRLLRENFSPLPLLEAVELLQCDALPRRAVCVTFDDGYADNEQFALPVLQKYQIPATVFVSTGFLNGGRMWNDSIIEALRIYPSENLDLRDLELGEYSLESYEGRLAAVEGIIGSIKHLDPNQRTGLVTEIEKRVADLPNDLMLTDVQVRSLAAGNVAIGAHTVNHPILASISDEAAGKEILDSKIYLESLLQNEIDVFAYPNGKPGADYNIEHRNLVKNLGFKAAVSTHWGVGSNQSDRYQLPRFTPWDRGVFKFAVRLMANYGRGDPLISAGR